VATLLFRTLADYRSAQIATNARKIGHVFACEAELQAVAADLMAHVQPVVGICHGARNGWEVETLRNLLGCDVQGTDLAPTAAEYGLIQMDFHTLPNGWDSYFDFVYSNSLDHAHDPATAVRNWVRSLRVGGRLYLSHCRNSERAQNLADCYGATLIEYEALVRGCCQHVKTIWLGDQANPDGGVVKSLAVIVGERVA
jgi:SAM-dependent methyltransferase